MIDQPSMAIVIDCWNLPEYTRHDWYNQTVDNIVQFCQESPYIETIALSTFSPLSDYTISCDRPWYENGKQLFYDETKWDILRRMWNQVSLHDTTFTHPDILDIRLRTDQTGFVFFDSIQILYYCNFVNTAIRNIYFCGFAWNQCIKYRPTGWLELVALINANMFFRPPNILVKTNCIGEKYGALKQPAESWWEHVSDDIYQLNVQDSAIYDLI